jgi:hypothetical protein
MWTVEQRQAYDRAGLRYPSDLTDEEWFSRRLRDGGGPRGRRGAHAANIRAAPNPK